jgi:septum formation protein
MSTYTVVLASGSPRRKDLLNQLGIEPVIIAPNIDETPRHDESPTAFASRMAKEKAYGIALGLAENRLPGHVRPTNAYAVLAADTVVDLDGQIFGKPTSDDHARDMLRALSGRTHRVHTAVVVVSGMGEAFPGLVTSLVTMVPITDQLLDWYIATGEPSDKAGAYAVQGQGAILVDKVVGSMSNVVGLPLTETVELLSRAGCPVSPTPEPS